MARELNLHSRARARPLAELSMDGLASRAEALAQQWAAALVIARAIEDIGALPLQDIAREGSVLCAQMLRALQSDVELDRLTGAGKPTGREQSAPARRLGALAGAVDAVGTVEAVEVLRGVLWEALLDEFGWLTGERSTSRQLLDLADRLGFVCARALGVAVAVQEAGTDVGGREDPAVVLESSVQAEAPTAHSRAVIVDERLASDQVQEPATPGGSAAATGSPAGIAEERPLSWDESPPVVPPATRSGEIEIRDERGEEGPAAWIGTIGRQLTRYADDGVPFAVLLVEPLDLDRLRRSEGTSELGPLTDQLEEALAVVWPGALTRQRVGRYWLLAPATNRLGAQELAQRLHQAVAAAVTHRGAPLQLAVGTAACPDDGSEPAALAAHADVGLYAARSAMRGATGHAPAPVDGSST